MRNRAYDQDVTFADGAPEIGTKTATVAVTYRNTGAAEAPHTCGVAGCKSRQTEAGPATYPQPCGTLARGALDTPACEPSPDAPWGSSGMRGLLTR